MQSETLELVNLSDRDIEAWRDLADRAIEPNPFFEPDYVLPLAHGLDRIGAVRLAIARDPSGWQFCLPFHTPSSWHRLPLPAISTWRGHILYGLLGTPLVAGDDPAAAIAATLAELSSARVAFLALEWVAEGRVGRLIEEVLDRRPRAPLEFERFERAAVQRRSEDTYLEGQLSSKHRRELRRQRRKLGEELGAEPQLVDRSGSEAATRDLVVLEAASKKARMGTVIAADEGHARFFTEMCAGFAKQGRLQLVELRCGDQTVAAKCSLIAGDTIFSLKIAYDERWSAFSPGILLVLDLLKDFHQRTEINILDSCADPNNEMINRLWPDRRTLVTQVAPAGGAVDLLALPALRGLREVRDRNRARGERRSDG